MTGAVNGELGILVRRKIEAAIRCADL